MQLKTSKKFIFTTLIARAHGPKLIFVLVSKGFLDTWWDFFGSSCLCLSMFLFLCPPFFTEWFWKKTLSNEDMMALVWVSSLHEKGHFQEIFLLQPSGKKWVIHYSYHLSFGFSLGFIDIWQIFEFILWEKLRFVQVSSKYKISASTFWKDCINFNIAVYILQISFVIWILFFWKQNSF